jgi:hypothetical protein
VPPYLREVVPSACWNASKMIFCLCSGMPMPVSVHREGQHRAGVVEVSLSGLQPSVAAFIVRLTPPRSVNLKALESRFLSTCCRRRGSV